MEVGERIPSERQLCQIYNISRTTVRNAITDLEHSGLLTRIQGKGTFIQNPKKSRQNLSNYYSFTEETKKIGKSPKTIILEYHIQKADTDVAQNLGITTKDLIIQFERLRLANNEPMLLETTFIKYEDFPEITRILLEKMPLYEIFENKYKRKITKVNEKFSVTLLNSKQSHLLDVKLNNPCLKIIRYSYDKENNIVEYTVSYASGDKFNYESTYYPK